MQTTRKEKVSRNPAQWIDVVSRELVGVLRWQETVKDRKAWRTAIPNTNLTLCAGITFWILPNILNGPGIRGRKRCVLVSACVRVWAPVGMLTLSHSHEQQTHTYK